MSGSFNSSDDAFVPNIDDIDNEIDEPESSRKTAPIWNYVTCKDPAHPGYQYVKNVVMYFLLSQETRVLNDISQVNTV